MVIEKWITPSLFKDSSAGDEHDLHLNIGSDLPKLHYESFITDSDFEYLHDNGIDSVRIPVGYWLFGDFSPFPKTVQYLDKAMEQAQKYKIKVIIDLHALPGSQNGYDHSGKVGAIGWHKDPKNIELSLELVEKVAQRYKNSPILFGIELINEPHYTIPYETLAEYYTKGYKAVRNHCSPKVGVIFSDAFRPHIWKKLLSNPMFENIYMDVHFYQCFDANYKGLSTGQTITRAKKEWGRIINDLSKYVDIICGEWSLAINYSYLSDFQNAFMKSWIQQYGEMQKEIFGKTAGHYFWTYKTEASSEHAYDWSLRAGISQGVFTA